MAQKIPKIISYTEDSLKNIVNDLMLSFEFDNLDELLDKVILEFPDIVKYKDYNPKDLEIYEYKKPKRNINCLGFYAHCFKSKKIR
jgi:hypothetical protein